MNDDGFCIIFLCGFALGCAFAGFLMALAALWIVL